MSLHCLPASIVSDKKAASIYMMFFLICTESFSSLPFKIYFCFRSLNKMRLGVVFLFVKLLGYISLRITHTYNHTHNNPTYIIDKISLTDHGSFVLFFSQPLFNLQDE